MFSCQKNETEHSRDNETKEVYFHAIELDTKTAFGERTGDGKYPTLWTENDTEVKVSLNYAAAKDATVHPSDDFKTASFSAKIDDDASESYTFYALSPASAQYSAYSSSTQTVGVNIPATQNSLSSSVDEAAQILVARSDHFTVFPDNVELQFTHATAYGRMSLTNLNLGDAVISSISLTASSNFAGRYLYSPETGLLTQSSATNTITVNTNTAADIWFACAPVDLSNGGTMKVVVNTDKGTYTRNITFPAEKGNFIAGQVAKFSVNMQGVSLVPPKVYTLVKSKSELTVGSEVIIVAYNKDFALSTTQNSSNIGAAGVTKKGETIENPSDGVQTFTLLAGGLDNTASFYTEKGGEGSYLYSTASGELKKGNNGNNASWNISVTDDDGIATINNAQNTTYNLKYNVSSNLFKCYTTAQTDVCIYKLNGSGTATQIFLPELDAPVLTVTADNDAKKVIVLWTDVPNATSYEVVCGEKQVSVNPGVQTATFVMDDFGTFIITVTAKAAGYKSAVASSTATLEEPGVTEWVDVLNNSFIGVSGTTYSIWDSKKSNSPALYAGNSAGRYDAIQLRSSDQSGIITTSSGGYVKRIVVQWNSNTENGRTLDIYGKSTPYESAADLYNASNKGAKLGSIVCGTSTELIVTGEYQYIGLRSNSGAMYLDEIQITWAKDSNK